MSNNEFNKKALDTNNVSQESSENIFDVIGDFFAKMLKGIFVFVFCKLPIELWKIISNIEQLKKILKYLYSIVRAIVLCLLWIVVVFLGWWFFLREQFIRFWQKVWELTCMFFFHTLDFFKANAGWIWMIVALSGSIYGLLYVTLKRRASRQGKEFKGVFGWLKRHKKADNEPANVNQEVNDKENTAMPPQIPPDNK